MSTPVDKRTIWENLAFFTGALTFCIACWWGLYELLDDPVRALIAIFN